MNTNLKYFSHLVRFRGVDHVCAACVCLILSVPAMSQTPDFATDSERASKTLARVLPGYVEQIEADGDLAGANTKLLASFPAATRTATESLLLGNVLFETDRKRSYELHRDAFNADPSNPKIIWEWALEQHRAQDFAGALASYQQFSKVEPGAAASYALQADCLLNLNRVDEAIETWRKSEDAPDGSVETMENMVCAVHREPGPHQHRCDLLAKAINNQDVDAAVELVALDCDFPKDWWNGGPYEPYLSHDAPKVLAALKLPVDDIRNRGLGCAVECAGADQHDSEAVKKILLKYRLLIDPEHTVGADGGLLSVIVATATNSKAIDETVLRQQIAPKVLDVARKTKDTQLWNIAAFLQPPALSDDSLGFEREGWKATGDVRFAAGVLLLKLKEEKLAGDDADLAAALKQFPDSGLVQRAAYDVAKRENKITKTLLANAARAQFRHFTSFVAFATVINRPRSDYLRSYFAQMLEMPRDK